MQCATTTSEQTIPRLLFKKHRLYGARILDHIQGRKNRKKKKNKLENLTIFPAVLSKRVTQGFEVPPFEILIQLLHCYEKANNNYVGSKVYYQNFFLDEFENQW